MKLSCYLGKLETETFCVKCHRAIVSHYFMTLRGVEVVAENLLLFLNLKATFQKTSLDKCCETYRAPAQGHVF